ncbi:MAG: type II toxin-antitoxin system HicA family toxin [Verrucomicrobiales bacterium]|nr:type II toxin-antitoxin system HicA family toxin [Verrucomicrobiales bacterium]
MKRRELIQRIEAMGCRLVRHGGKHDWYQNPETGMAQPVPRHREIREFVAQTILKKLS